MVYTSPLADETQIRIMDECSRCNGFMVEGTCNTEINGQMTATALNVEKSQLICQSS